MDAISYEFATFEVMADDDDTPKTVKVRGYMSHEWHTAQAKYDILTKAAKEQDIELTEVVNLYGIKAKQPTRTGAELEAMLTESLVVDWPLSESLHELLTNEALKGESSFSSSIRMKANEVTKKWADSKKEQSGTSSEAQG